MILLKNSTTLYVHRSRNQNWATACIQSHLSSPLFSNFHTQIGCRNLELNQLEIKNLSARKQAMAHETEHRLVNQEL